MSNKKTRKLALRKDTLRTLGKEALTVVAGGYVPPSPTHSRVQVCSTG